MLIFYINIAARTDRRRFMEEQFARLGLVARRIDAATPDQLTREQMERWCNPRRGRWVTPSELSCGLSHLSAMRALLETGTDRALILEDDTFLSARLPRFLSELDKQAMPAGVVSIEATLKSMRLDRAVAGTIEGIALSRPYSWASGAGAYVVSRAAAERIVPSPEMQRRPADHALLNPYMPIPRMVGTLQANPGLAIQTDRLQAEHIPALASNIEDRETRQADERPYLRFRLAFIVAEFFERDIVIAGQKLWHQVARGARKRRIEFLAE